MCMFKSGYGQSGVWTIKITISQEWNNGITDFMHAGTNLW